MVNGVGEKIMIRLTIAKLALFLFVLSAWAQTPPTATEAFNLRIKCKALADEKAEAMMDHPLTYADGATAGMSTAAVDALNRNNAENRELVFASHSSKYDAKTNRCYIEIFNHVKVGVRKSIDLETRAVDDGQTDDVLAFTKIENGQKVGIVNDRQHQRPANLGPNLGWDDANEYMDQMMFDDRR